jgi:acyl dehydratase
MWWTVTPTVRCSDPTELHAFVDVDLPPTAWAVLDQQAVSLFADATGDHQWIHVDPERAATGPYGTTIAHGYLTLSLIGPLFAEVLLVERASRVVNYGLDRVRFPAPLLVGSRVRLTSRITSATVVSGGVQIVVHAAVECDGSDRPVCVADVIYRYFT